jgi:DNA-binding NtrC family response regulator
MKEKIKILLVDDESNSTQILGKVLRKKGYEVFEENNSIQAKELIIRNFYDIIISDLQMPNVSGMDLLEIKPERSIFIMITGYGSVVSAVESMKKGAFDYVNKPFNLDEFIIKVEKAADKVVMQSELNKLKEIVENENSFCGIIGKSEKMLEIFNLLRNVSKVNINSLIYGESGTGKELIAKAIHNLSDRSSKPFVAVNCSAIPENLLESELFGHTKGAFTGAIESQKGVFEQANEGTLFLDEIGEMPFNLQAKLLRVLENFEVKPLGSDKVKKIDIRLISATNQNLEVLTSEKKFRDDLYYRIATVTINLPPLRARRGDIPLIAYNYLKKLAVKFGSDYEITAEAMQAIMNYEWKGNVRELENVLDMAAIKSPCKIIDVSSLPFQSEFELNTGDNIMNKSNLCTLMEVEKSYIKRILAATEGNKQKAAEILQIDRKTLYKKIKDYNL